MAVAPIQFNTVNNPQVPYFESNFIGFEIGTDDQTSERHLQVPGDKLFDFTLAVKGWTEYDPGSKTLIRNPPERHPIFNAHYVESVSYIRELAEPTPLGINQTLQYDLTEVSVRYQAKSGIFLYRDELKPAGFDSEEWRFVRVEKKANLEARPFAKGVLLYNENDKATMEPASQFIAGKTWRIHWLQIPTQYVGGTVALPGALQANIDATVGHMNSDTIIGAPPQTLLLIDYELEYRTQANGTPCVNIIFVALQRGSKDLTAGALRDVATTDPDFTRILRIDGKFYRVYRQPLPGAPADKNSSIYPAATFKSLFKFV